MKLISIILLSFTLPLSHLAAQPNIVLINADDFGWKDSSYAGSDFYETPHIDALAASGMTFSQAYAGASLCQPSRACDTKAEENEIKSDHPNTIN